MQLRLESKKGSPAKEYRIEAETWKSGRLIANLIMYGCGRRLRPSN